ncbi:MAG: hypothetical protein A2Y58_00070 [Chloroflexi bacterium RBG_13_51_52]|nr:MAG: hypothetical protein A2Y58_00070 [Chloroflexi bacterium RBG_13_51_52]
MFFQENIKIQDMPISCGIPYELRNRDNDQNKTQKSINKNQRHRKKIKNVGADIEKIPPPRYPSLCFRMTDETGRIFSQYLNNLSV